MARSKSNLQFGRLSNTSTNLPLAYGSIAFYLGSKSNEYQTHKWTLYVRSPDPSYDISVAISKVIFQLHPSFAQPTREVSEPPYEVTETGWGEFEASIRIVWREDAQERSTIVTHGIKLYPKNIPANAISMDPSTYMNTTVPVVSEKYDEVVFTNPKVSFHESLLNGRVVKNKKKLSYPLSNESLVIDHFRTYSDEEEVKSMLAAKKFLEGELRKVKDRLLRVDADLEEVKRALAATAEWEIVGNVLPPIPRGGGGGKSANSGAANAVTVGAIAPSTDADNTTFGTAPSYSKKGNTSGKTAGGKTMKKRGPPPPSSISASLKPEQPSGKKIKSC